MKGKPIVYVPINRELKYRHRIQRKYVQELILKEWKDWGTVTLEGACGLKIVFKIMEAPE